MIESGAGEHHLNEGRLRVLAEMAAGKSFAEIADEVGFSLDQAQAVLALFETMHIPLRDLRGGEGVVHEKLLPDEYTVANLKEVLDGGGTTWVPLFQKTRADEIKTDDQFQQLPEKGLLHLTAERKSLKDLLERTQSGESLAAKELSMRCLEISILRRRLGEETPEKVALLQSGLNGESVIKQAEELGLFDKTQGHRIGDGDFLRETCKNNKELLLDHSLLRLRSKIGVRLKPSRCSATKDKNVFLPHIHERYANVFGKYIDAKTASPALKT